MDPKEYEEELKKHDWYYHMSEDHSVFKQGMDNHKRLQSLALLSEKHNSLYHEHAIKNRIK